MSNLIELCAIFVVAIIFLLILAFPLVVMLTLLYDTFTINFCYLNWVTDSNKWHRYIVSLLIYGFAIIGIISLVSCHTNPNAIYRDGNTIYITTVDKNVVSYDYTEVSDFTATADVLSSMRKSIHNCYRFNQYYPYNGNYGFNNYPNNLYIPQQNYSVSNNSTREYNIAVSLQLKSGENLKFIVDYWYKKQLYIALYSPENVHEYVKETEQSKYLYTILVVVFIVLLIIPNLIHFYTLFEYTVFRIKCKKRDEIID